MPGIAAAVAATYLVLLVMALVWNATTALVGVVRARMAGRPSRQQGSTGDPRTVITLVHGTWARSARWVEPGSPLRDAVAAVSGPVRFERFIWSGHNSVTARQRAGRRLTEHLRGAFVEWPDARHYVIAHSHGGNIALQSMADDVVSRRVSGVVCLSTPFLTITPRQLGPVGRTVLWWVPVVIVFYGGSGLLRTLMPGASDAWGVLLLVAGMATGFAASRAMRKATGRLVEALRYPVVDPSKVLIVRAPADEASAALSAAHLLSWFAGMLWSGSARLLEDTVQTVERWREWIVRHRWWSASVAFCCAAMVVSWLVAGVRYEDLPVPGAVVIVLVLVPLVTLAIVTHGGLVAFIVIRLSLAILVTPLIAVIALVGMTVGPELVLAGLLFHVTAEAVPPGRWTVFQAGVERDGDAADGPHAPGLMHSLSYQHPAALRYLSRFIEERLSSPR